MEIFSFFNFIASFVLFSFFFSLSFFPSFLPFCFFLFCCFSFVEVDKISEKYKTELLFYISEFENATLAPAQVMNRSV